MLGTVLGIATLLSIIGLANTASGQISDKFSELEARTVTVLDSAAKIGDPSYYNFPDAVAASLSELNGVRSGGVYWQIPIGDENQETYFGKTPQAAGNNGVKVRPYAAGAGLLEAVEAKIAAGRAINYFDERDHTAVAVLGAEANRILKIADLSTNPTVFINNTAYSVVGVLENSGSLPELELAIILPNTTAFENYGPPSTANPARAVINTDLGAAKLISIQAPLKLRPDNPKLLTSLPLPDWSKATGGVSQALDSLLIGLAAIALIIGAVGITNTTLVAVLERRSEIGLRQALGAKRSHISLQFLIESSLIGLIGSFIGVAIGIGVIIAVSISQSWSPIIDPRIIGAGPILGSLVGMLAGAYPAWKASRVEVVQAIQG